MELVLEAEGDVVERQQLLNGTESVTFEASSDGDWILGGTVSWNLGLVDYAGEGDLTLTRDDGAEIFATLVRADVHDAAEDSNADHRGRLRYEIDGGTAPFGGASGAIDATIELAGDRIAGVWSMRLADSTETGNGAANADS
jgi:hypothetical protein